MPNVPVEISASSREPYEWRLGKVSSRWLDWKPYARFSQKLLLFSIVVRLRPAAMIQATRNHSLRITFCCNRNISLCLQVCLFAKIFTEENNACYEWFSFTSSVKVSSSIWTHVAVTWDHATEYSTIYVDGKSVGYRTYSRPRTLFFYPPTGEPYKIGNDVHWNDHQFYGSVMDLYVFGTALSLDKINKLRGWCLIRRYKYKSMVIY